MASELAVTILFVTLFWRSSGSLFSWWFRLLAVTLVWVRTYRAAPVTVPEATHIAPPPARSQLVITTGVQAGAMMTAG